MCAADILLVPQTKIIFNVAALPTKLSEYCLMNKAIIVTNIGDVDQYFIDNYNAILLSEASIEEISKSMIKLIENRQLITTLGNNAYKTAIEKFNRKVLGKFIIQNIHT